ncbi:MipA/OmpV family protein [Paucibacter sp. JuS9]|uniref:MipA/OmpV family protein n=1 Tax=Paucibacter sp. JuS9 TaxID=3228748 RepID=UPI00375660A2
MEMKIKTKQGLDAPGRSLRPWGLVSAVALLAGVGLCAFEPAQAAGNAEAGTEVSAPTPAWEMRWGGALASWQRFPGADKSRLMAIPLFEASHRSGFFASSLRGVGWEFRLGEVGRVSLAGGFDARERRRKDDPRALVLGEHKMRPAFLAAAELQFGPAYLELNAVARLRTRDREHKTRLGTYVSPYKDHGDGATVDLEVGMGMVRTERLQLRGGLRVAAMDSRFAENFYAVPAEIGVAATPPIRPYRIGSGVVSAGLGLQAQVQIDKDWTFTSRMNLDRLRGAAATSPLVQERNQPSLMMTISRPL